MNILSIGSDRKVFESHSRVRERLVAYGEAVDSYAVVVTCGRGMRYTGEEKQPSPRVSLYPTYSYSRFLYPLSAIRLGMRIMRNRKHDDDWVVTAQDPFESGLSAWWVAWRCNTPLQVQLHTDPFSAHFLKYSLLNRLRSYIARWVIPRASRLRVVSETLKQRIHDVYAVPLDRIDVLPVFVEEGDQTVEGHPIRDALPHDAKVVLMVGRLAIEKDMVTAFEAFARVIEAAPHTYLVIVGDGPLRPQLEKIASNEKFQGKVLFLGWQQNVYPYFRDADVFLFTSLYEGYGMVLIEAAVAGKGIVTTDVGIAKEFFGAQRAARVCPVGDSVCLGREVADLIAHDENRMLMGLRAQRIARSLYVSTLSEYTQKQVLIWKSMVKKQ